MSLRSSASRRSFDGTMFSRYRTVVAGTVAPNCCVFQPRTKRGQAMSKLRQRVVHLILRDSVLPICRPQTLANLITGRESRHLVCMLGFIFSAGVPLISPIGNKVDIIIGVSACDLRLWKTLFNRSHNVNLHRSEHSTHRTPTRASQE
jgi:hypothetical protein